MQKNSNNALLSLKNEALQLAVDELRQELLEKKDYGALQRLEAEYKKQMVEDLNEPTEQNETE